MQILGLSESTIRRGLKAGRFEAEMERGVWTIILPDEDEMLPGSGTQHDDRIERTQREFIAYLQEQLRAKDEQMGQLFDELRETRRLALPPPDPERRPWWKRMFGR